MDVGSEDTGHARRSLNSADFSANSVGGRTDDPVGDASAIGMLQRPERSAISRRGAATDSGGRGKQLDRGDGDPSADRRPSSNRGRASYGSRATSDVGRAGDRGQQPPVRGASQPEG